MTPMSINRWIPEGFKGQHLVVVPEIIRRRFERHPLLDGLLVTDAGFFPHASGHFMERREGATTTLLIVCLAGRGWVRIGDREHVVEPGNIVWLGARRPHSYGADSETPWTIEWAHVTGKEVGAWTEFL